MKKPIFGGLMAACLCFFAHAENTDEIVVSATGIPTPAAQVGSTVDVITAADLEQLQISHVQDALAMVAGISSYSSGGVGAVSNVFVRGLTGKYSGVYIDGVQINDPASQQTAWAYIPTHGIDRVEVLRGTQGVLYGSEAIGGAINLFTAYGGATQNRVTLEHGTFASTGVSLSSKGQADNIGYGLFIQSADTDGISAANEANGNSEEDGYESLAARARVVVDVTDRLSIDTALRSISSEVETDAGFGRPVDNGANYVDFDSLGGRLAVRLQANDWQHGLSYGRSEDITSSYAAFALTTEGTREVLGYRGILELSPQVQLLIGYEDESETYQTSDATYEADNQAVLALLQYGDAAGLSASFAVRQDDNEAFGKFDTSRIAAKKMFGQFGFRGSYGTGFRAPSLYELYGLSVFCVAGVCGNDDLQPEESRGRDLAVIFEPTRNISVELVQFKITVRDLVAFGSAPTDASDPCRALNFATTCGKYIQSDGKSRSRGYELRGTVQLSADSALGLNFTKLDAETETGARDIRRPEETLNISLAHRVSDRLSGRAAVQIVKNVIDTDFGAFPNVNVALDDYTLVRLSAAYRLNDSVKISARLENALDDTYETVLGYGTPGRAVYGAVSVRF